MKRIIAFVIAAVFVIGLTACTNENLFVADDDLMAQVKPIMDELGDDYRVKTYLLMHDRLLTYNSLSAHGRKEIQSQLDLLKERYMGLTASLKIDEVGLTAVNEALFDYLVVSAFYSQNELDEVVLSESESIKDNILRKGYTYANEWKNTTSQIGTMYFYLTETGHDPYNYFSVNTLEGGEVEHMSMPLAYELRDESYMNAYVEMTEDQRKAEFESNLQAFVESADIVNNDILALIYSAEELVALDSFLTGLTADYINENSIVSEETPYSNKQLLVELGDTRYILRITVYGLFMDAIHDKDYYDCDFSKSMDILRRAYIGTEEMSDDDSRYIIITPQV